MKAALGFLFDLVLVAMSLFLTDTGENATIKLRENNFYCEVDWGVLRGLGLQDWREYVRKRA
jgi:hypothetical protein